MRWLLAACYMEFEAWHPAGSNDCIEQLQRMLDVAGSWGCLCIPPSPRAMLEHTRSNDELGSSWSKYVQYAVPGRLLDSAPGERVDFDGDLGVLGTGVVRFRADPKLNFWGHDSLYRKLSQGARNMLLFPSDELQKAVEQVVDRWSPFVALKVRRGDLLAKYAKICRPLTREFVKGLVPNETVFVMSEGFDFGLSNSFTERDLPRTKDSIFDYLVGLRVAQHATKYVVVHPKYSLHGASIRTFVDNIRSDLHDTSLKWIPCSVDNDVAVGFVLENPTAFYRRATALMATLYPSESNATVNGSTLIDRIGTFPFVGHLGG